MTAETLPFFAPKRLIYVRDSKLFAPGRKDDSEKMAAYLPDVYQETIIVFMETDVDKRSKLFKQISKTGCVLDCTTPTPQNMETWIRRLAKEKSKALSPQTAAHILRTVPAGMVSIAQEMDKLLAFCSHQEEVTIADVNAICTPTLESRIFDLVKAVCTGQTKKALSMYNDMLTLKEEPIKILVMIIRQFRIILLVKCAKEKGMTIYETAQELALRDFMVSEALGQGNKFTTEELLQALRHCQDTDTKIKSGIITPELGVEMLIVKTALA